ncbi:MAG: hypothetical protein ACYSSP_13600 [Planctomycetota bacterium]|jgi:uncharacterized protein YaaN involved in tellurite resistance
MKKTVGILLPLVALVFIFITGCEQAEETIEVEVPGEKQARLITIENAQLKEKIQELNRQLKKQTREYEDEINGLKISLNKSQETNNELRNLLKDDSNWQQFEDFMSKIVSTIGEENENLRTENVILTDEIKKLKERIKELEGGIEE